MGNVMPLMAARNLSRPWRARLTQSLRIKLSCELSHPANEPFPPGAVDYHADVVVFWSLDAAADAEPVDQRILAGLSRDATEEDGLLYLRVGAAELTVAEAYQAGCWEALEARSADLAAIAGTVLDLDGGGLIADLDERVEAVGNELIVVNDVHIAERWRGLRLGLIGTGLILQRLGHAPSSLAVLHAMEPGLDDEHEREIAHRRLTSYWTLLGFEPFRDQVMVLDLALITLDKAMHELTQQQ